MHSTPRGFARAAAEAGRANNKISAVQAGGGALILAVLGDRNLVFSEERQAVYELDDASASAFRSLDPEMSADQILREMIDVVVDRDQTENVGEVALVEFPAQEHASVTSLPLCGAKQVERLTPLIVRLAGVAVHLHLSEPLAADVRAVLGRHITDAQQCDAELSARLAGRTVIFSSPGLQDWSCDHSQFVPLLKAQLVEFLLQCARYEVALHAAALLQEDEAVLLVGSPGAGKTTLAIALAKAGLEVVADDVTLLNEQGQITGVPFPFAAKASSWPLLSSHWPGILTKPSHWRPDGKELCYIHPETTPDPQPRRIGSVVLLDRQDQGHASIEKLNPVDALTAFIAEGATRDERLSQSGFTALVEGLREACCVRLTYSDLIEAADAVCSMRSQ